MEEGWRELEKKGEEILDLYSKKKYCELLSLDEKVSYLNVIPSCKKKKADWLSDIEKLGGGMNDIKDSVSVRVLVSFEVSCCILSNFKLMEFYVETKEECQRAFFFDMIVRQFHSFFWVMLRELRGEDHFPFLLNFSDKSRLWLQEKILETVVFWEEKKELEEIKKSFILHYKKEISSFVEQPPIFFSWLSSPSSELGLSRHLIEEVFLFNIELISFLKLLKWEQDEENIIGEGVFDRLMVLEFKTRFDIPENLREDSTSYFDKLVKDLIEQNEWGVRDFFSFMKSSILPKKQEIFDSLKRKYQSAVKDGGEELHFMEERFCSSFCYEDWTACISLVLPVLPAFTRSNVVLSESKPPFFYGFLNIHCGASSKEIKESCQEIKKLMESVLSKYFGRHFFVVYQKKCFCLSDLLELIKKTYLVFTYPGLKEVYDYFLFLGLEENFSKLVEWFWERICEEAFEKEVSFLSIVDNFAESKSKNFQEPLTGRGENKNSEVFSEQRVKKWLFSFFEDQVRALVELECWKKDNKICDHWVSSNVIEDFFFHVKTVSSFESLKWKNSEKDLLFCWGQIDKLMSFVDKPPFYLFKNKINEIVLKKKISFSVVKKRIKSFISSISNKPDFLNLLLKEKFLDSDLCYDDWEFCYKLYDLTFKGDFFVFSDKKDSGLNFDSTVLFLVGFLILVSGFFLFIFLVCRGKWRKK